MILRRQPLCQICLKTGLYTQAQEVHHIKPIRERPDLRLDAANLQALCKPCHSTLTAQASGWRN